MKIAEFTYKKVNGKISDRKVLVVSEARSNMLAIDLQELNTEDAAIFAGKMAAAHDEYMAKYAALLAEFELTNSIRQFKPEEMTNIKLEGI